MKKIGLTLGGGGAKGFAHIPTLEVFDELGVKPACVTGTSIGAIIGALYCSGLSAKQIVEMSMVPQGASLRHRLPVYVLPLRLNLTPRITITKEKAGPSEAPLLSGAGWTAPLRTHPANRPRLTGESARHGQLAGPGRHNGHHLLLEKEIESDLT